MALTTRQIAFSNPSRATRQQIPPFLSKLYFMVDDTSTDPLIRWSDSGDSFYVFDHERFAKEVLPRWFKHGNFGSFVRQLNNYGFHKVPHLQQGVLRSDGETEISHFENPHFRRDESNLLCLIQRKRQGHDIGEDIADAIPPTTATAQVNGTETEPPSPNSTVPKGTVMDISGILNGIQAIKRHQHAISAELKELHQSNEGLWQEACAARERHKKHNDTITRILKFLAGVFGQNANSPRAQEVPHESSGENSTIIQRRPNRLMIEAAGKKGGDVTLNGSKLNIHDFMESLDFEGGQANDGDRFSTVETVGSRGVSPTPSIAKESIAYDAPTPSSTMASTAAVAKTTVPKPLTPKFSEGFSPHFATTTTTNPTTPSTNAYHSSTALTCSTPPPISSVTGTDSSYLQNALAALLGNPVQLQRVLGTLQVPMTIPSESSSNHSDVIGSANNINTRTDFSSSIIPDYRSLSDNNSFVSTLSLLDAPSNLGLLSRAGDDNSLNALAQSSQHLQKTYKDTKDVEADVNALQGHIDSLIESLGLDSSTNAVLRGEQPVDEIVSSDPPVPVSDSTLPPSTTTTTTVPSFSETSTDLDFDSFLTQDFYSSGFSGLGQGFELNSATQTQGSEKIGAFLDEVQSVSNESDIDITAPDDVQRQQRDGGRGSTRKRKSDAIELADPKGIAALRTMKKKR